MAKPKAGEKDCEKLNKKKSKKPSAKNDCSKTQAKGTAGCPKKDDDCIILYNVISAVRDEINRRSEEMLIDKCDQFNLAYDKVNPSLPGKCGTTTYIGHGVQIGQKQRRIKRKIAEAKDKRCSLPKGAYKAAMRQIPKRPRGIVKK